MEIDLTLAQSPSIPRRLGVMLYDVVLLIGVLMVANAIIVIPYEVIIGNPLYEHALALNLLRMYLLAIAVGFYVYFWTHGGQTLGMSAWRVRVVGDDGKALGTGAALVRLGVSIPSILLAGLGLWLSDRNGLAWHDRKSHSRLVMLQKAA